MSAQTINKPIYFHRHCILRFWNTFRLEVHLGSHLENGSEACYNTQSPITASRHDLVIVDQQ